MIDPRDDLAQPEYLEDIMARLARLEGRIDPLERERLEQLLGGPSTERIALPDIPSMRLGASDVDRTLGNVVPFYGQSNLLKDPTFETLGDVSPIGTVETATGVWKTKYVLNSGTAPTTRALRLPFFRDSDYNPFNSAVARLDLSGFAAGDTTFYVYAGNGFVADADVETLPYIVASCRIGDFGDLQNTLTNVTSISVSLEVLNSIGGVVAESPVLDYKAMVGRRPEIQQIFAAYSGGTDTFTWRLKVVVVASGASGILRIQFGEPHLHYAYSPDPAPFAPQIGRWNPNRLILAAVDGDRVNNGWLSWDGTNFGVLVGDGVRQKPVTPVGWLPYAYMPGFAATAALVAQNLGAAGTFLIPIVLTAPIKLNSVSFWCTDAATQRTWGWDLYADRINDSGGHGAPGDIDRVAQSSANETFTPVAASLRTITASGAPVILPPGLLWLALQNRHATNTLGVGSIAAGSMNQNSARSKVTTNPNGATLDADTGWTSQQNLYGVRLNGRVFDEAGAF